LPLTGRPYIERDTLSFANLALRDDPEKSRNLANDFVRKRLWQAVIAPGMEGEDFGRIWTLKT